MTTGVTSPMKGASTMDTLTETDERTPAERFLALSPEEQEAVLSGQRPLDPDDDEALDDDEAETAREYDDDTDDEAADEERVPHFRVDAEDEDTPTLDPDEFPFTLGRAGEPVEGAKVLIARRPKAAVLMRLASVDPHTKDLSTMVRVIDTFLDHVLDKESREYVRGRFDDPDDDWDVDLLVPVINACKARWYGRPTGRATGSSGSPNSRGKRSTARSSSRARRTRRR